MYLVQHESFHSSWRAGLLRIGLCVEIKSSKNSSSYINNMRFARYGAHDTPLVYLKLAEAVGLLLVRIGYQEGS